MRSTKHLEGAQGSLDFEWSCGAVHLNRSVLASVDIARDFDALLVQVYHLPTKSTSLDTMFVGWPRDGIGHQALGSALSWLAATWESQHVYCLMVLISEI